MTSKIHAALVSVLKEETPPPKKKNTSGFLVFLGGGKWESTVMVWFGHTGLSSSVNDIEELRFANLTQKTMVNQHNLCNV